MPVTLVHGHKVETVNEQGRTIFYIDGARLGDETYYNNWVKAYADPGRTKTTDANPYEGYGGTDPNRTAIKTGDSTGAGAQTGAAGGGGDSGYRTLPDGTVVQQTTGGAAGAGTADTTGRTTYTSKSTIGGTGRVLPDPIAGTTIHNHQTGQNYTVGGLSDPGTQIARTDFQVEGGKALQDSLNRRQAEIQARQAPTANVAAQTAGVTLSPAQQALAAQLGPASTAGAVNFGRAGTTQAATAADSPFRANQSALIDQLNRYATGQESVSQLQLRQNTDANVAQQMAMANSARPGQGAMASRLAAQNAGMANTQFAGQAAVAGLQERQANAAQLQQLLGTARGQDLQNTEFNAGQQNTVGMSNAQLANALAIAQGQSNTQVGISNSGQMNQQAQALAQLQSQTNIANMQSGNAYNLAGSQLQQNANQFNAQQLQQSNQFNTTAGLTAQQQNDAALRDALSQQGQLSQLGLQGTMGYEQQVQQRAALQQQLAQQMEIQRMQIAAGKPVTDSTGNVIGGAAAGAAAGSAFGPWGAAAGGVIGGIAGAFK